MYSLLWKQEVSFFLFRAQNFKIFLGIDINSNLFMADLDAFVVDNGFFAFTEETFRIDIFEILLVDLVDLEIEITLLEITADLEVAGFIVCTGYGAVIVDNECTCTLENTILDAALGKFKIQSLYLTSEFFRSM